MGGSKYQKSRARVDRYPDLGDVPALRLRNPAIGQIESSVSIFHSELRGNQRRHPEDPRPIDPGDQEIASLVREIERNLNIRPEFDKYIDTGIRDGA